LLEEYRDDLETNLNNSKRNNDQLKASSANQNRNSFDNNSVQESNQSAYFNNPREDRFYNQEPDKHAGYFSKLSSDRRDIEHMLGDNRSGCLKNFILGFVSLAVILASFIASFYVGKKIFLSDSIVKEEFSTISVKNDVSNVKSRLHQIKNKLIVSPDIVPPQEEEFTTFSSVRDTKPPKKQAVVPIKKVTPKKKIISHTAYSYKVIAGDYSQKDYAEDAVRNLTVDGFKVWTYKKGSRYRVQIGAFGDKGRANKELKKALDLGYNAFIATN